MKHKVILFIFGLIAICFFIYACPPDVAKESRLTFPIPKGWPEPAYKFDKTNKLTRAGFELGRTLFYDPRLSRNNTISCGSCHQQFAAFSHLDHAVSHGIDNKLGTRNAPALFNLAWQTSFFWDGGVNHIEVQPISPMQNPVEMDEKLEDVIARLNADSSYKKMFKNAFGDEEINSQRMLKALAQFMCMLVSSNSKYDRYMHKEPDAAFTEAELHGLTLFRERCATCHKEPLFTDNTYRNNGLMPKYTVDSGRAHITRLSGDLYKFKERSLRNLKYTFPYMHDGRFAELSQVIEHYAGEKFPSPTLDSAVHMRYYYSDKDKQDLMAFLNTLNDDTFVKDTMFRDNSNRQVMQDHTHNYNIK
jgi:cytochrome c peroxidase